jgi:predicted extracellular nuclease
MRRFASPIVVLCLLSLGVSASTSPPVAITSLGTPVNEDFNTLASTGTSSTTPAGWGFVESGTSGAVNGIYTANIGTGTAGDTYSYGNSSDRAFGALLSNTFTSVIGAQYRNDTGATITSLTIGYTGEQWRLGAVSRVDKLDFQISTNATALNDGTWTDVNAFDFTAPVTAGAVGALDGNAAANRTGINSTITGLNISPGSTFFIRWTDFNATGSDDGLAIDDFSIEASGVVVDQDPEVTSTTPANGATGVSVTSNIGIIFSESVSATGAFTLDCAGPIAFSQSASPSASFTLDPIGDLPFGTLCTVTVSGAQVVDPMASDYSFSFITADPPLSSSLVISQVYGGGGNGGATYTHDFVELFNHGTSPVALSGWSVQYQSAANAGTWQTTTLTGSIAPGGYYLIRQAPGAGGTTPLPTPEASGTVAMAAGAGKVALLNTTTPASGACPPPGSTADLVGYGAASCFEGVGPTAAPSNTTAVLRKRGGCFDSNSNNVDFSAGSPFPRNSATPPRSCTFTSAAIHAIQGDGPATPLLGDDVVTTGIVTARKSNGFFIQTAGDDDSNPQTSQGLFVFTSAAPAVAVGDAVTARGTATEFFNLTQLESSLPGDVTVDSSGNAIPAPVTLTTGILDANGTADQLERFEGMRLHAAALVSVAPTNEFGETLTVLSGVQRPMREPGIEQSLQVPPDPTSGFVDCCIPRWDENPERLMVDGDGLVGVPFLSVTSNVTITGVTGPLDFAFSNYKLLPEASPSVTPNMSAVPVPAPLAEELTIAGFNIENFAGNVTQKRKAALAIRQVLHSPDVLGHVEIADLASLEALATQVNTDAAADNEFPMYEARLIPSGQGSQHLGFLIKTSRVQITSVTQELALQTYENPVNHQLETLHDRPPLVLRATVTLPDRAPRPFIVVVNHLRSFIDIELPGGDGLRVRAKRTAQAEATAQLLQSLQIDNPGVPVISIGDYNAYQFNDGYTDPIAILKGMPTSDDEIVVDESPDLVEPNFSNLTDTLPVDQRYSFIFEGTPQALDHMLLNTVADGLVTRYAIARNNSDFPEGPLFASDVTRPERNSDHDMPVGYFFFPMTAIESLNTVTGDLQAVLDGGATGALRARIADALKKVEKALEYLNADPPNTHQAEIRVRQAMQDIEGLKNQGLLPAAVADELLARLAYVDSLM